MAEAKKETPQTYLTRVTTELNQYIKADDHVNYWEGLVRKAVNVFVSWDRSFAGVALYVKQALSAIDGGRDVVQPPGEMSAKIFVNNSVQSPQEKLVRMKAVVMGAAYFCDECCGASTESKQYFTKLAHDLVGIPYEEKKGKYSADINKLSNEEQRDILAPVRNLQRKAKVGLVIMACQMTQIKHNKEAMSKTLTTQDVKLLLGVQSEKQTGKQSDGGKEQSHSRDIPNRSPALQINKGKYQTNSYAHSMFAESVSKMMEKQGFSCPSDLPDEFRDNSPGNSPSNSS